MTTDTERIRRLEELLVLTRQELQELEARVQALTDRPPPRPPWNPDPEERGLGTI